MYQTKQKKLLLDYLKNNTQKQLSINDITNTICPDGCGRSTIYRLVSKLCDMGVLIKLQSDDSKSVLYQYVGEGTQCSSHFHLMCSECGTLLHLDCDHINKISTHILKNHNFKLDMKKTVLYGICSDCSVNEKGKTL